MSKFILQKPPVLATLLTLLGLLILCSLGAWQLQRLSWKNNLITKLESAYSQSTPQDITLKNNPPELTYGHIKGTLSPDKAFLLGPPQIHDETPGFVLIIPLKTQGRTLLINMGWTPAPLNEQPIHHLQGKEITFHGLLKKSRWNIFTPENQPEKNIWYRLHMTQIAQEKNLENIYPAQLIADQANYKFDAQFFTDSSKNRPAPNNNHLQYAFFWFALAAVLLSIYTLRFVFIKTP